MICDRCEHPLIEIDRYDWLRGCLECNAGGRLRLSWSYRLRISGAARIGNSAQAAPSKTLELYKRYRLDTSRKHPFSWVCFCLEAESQTACQTAKWAKGISSNTISPSRSQLRWSRPPNWLTITWRVRTDPNPSGSAGSLTWGPPTSFHIT